MNPKVTLIYPGEWFGWKELFAYIPLGIGYLASVLRNANIEVNILDFRFLKNWEEVASKLQDYKPEIIGISAYIPIASRAHQTAKIAKELLPDSKVILGGAYPTILYSEALSDQNIDVCVTGEAEHIIVELVQKLSNGISLEGIPSLAWRKKSFIYLSENRSFVENLDRIPFPAYDLFPMRDILKNGEIFPLPYPSMTILSSRGCPFNCTFCQPTLRNIFGKKIRYRSVKNVVDEIELLIKQYELKALLIQDDIFTFNKKRVEEFCDELDSRNIKLKWCCQSRADTLDTDIASRLSKSGCVMIIFGIESGSQKVLDLLDKKTTVEDNYKVMKICKDNNIIICADIMIGTPGETREDLEQTVKLIYKAGPEIVWVSITSPIPGTYLHDQVRELGLLNMTDKIDYKRFSFKKIKLNGITSSLLEKYYKKMTRDGFLITFINEPYYLNLCIQRTFAHLKYLNLKRLLVDFMPPSLRHILKFLLHRSLLFRKLIKIGQ